MPKRDCLTTLTSTWNMHD